jgi:DNA polymerase-3 subunit delta
LPDDTVTLVSLPDMDWQGKQTRWFVALEAAATVIEAQPVDRENLPRWLAGRLKRVNLSASSEALDFLADRVEGNLPRRNKKLKSLLYFVRPVKSR